MFPISVCIFFFIAYYIMWITYIKNVKDCPNGFEYISTLVYWQNFERKIFCCVMRLLTKRIFNLPCSRCANILIIHKMSKIFFRLYMVMAGNGFCKVLFIFQIVCKITSFNPAKWRRWLFSQTMPENIPQLSLHINQSGHVHQYLLPRLPSVNDFEYADTEKKSFWSMYTLFCMETRKSQSFYPQ